MAHEAYNLRPSSAGFFLASGNNHGSDKAKGLPVLEGPPICLRVNQFPDAGIQTAPTDTSPLGLLTGGAACEPG